LTSAEGMGARAQGDRGEGAWLARHAGRSLDGAAAGATARRVDWDQPDPGGSGGRSRE